MEAPPNDSLQQAEQPVIDERRKQAKQDATGPRIGLALSGGGIRSATFCLGLLRGLAKNGLLPKFDYLSTVSGGGYVGAALGRLIDRLGIHAAQAELARGKSPTLDWLRRNGRYLMPSGVRDYGIAIATYMRAGIAIHLELGALAILGALFIILPHLLQFQMNVLDGFQWWPWRTVWWPLAAFWWLLFAPGAMAAYWTVRDPSINQTSGNASKGVIAGADIAVLLLVAIATVILSVAPWQCNDLFAQTTQQCVLGTFLQRPLQSADLRVALWLALISVTARMAFNFVRLAIAVTRNKPPAVARTERRNALTMAVRRANLFSGWMLLFGLLDVVSWELKEAVDRGTAWLIGGIGLGTVMVTFGRSFLEPLKKLTAAENGRQIIPLSLITNVLGIIAGLLVLIGWTTLVQWLVFADSNPDVPDWFNQQNVGVRAWVVAALPLAWIIVTFANVETINASSLHGFYRGRLIRAYLRVGNKTLSQPTQSSASDVVSGDDISLDKYAPHKNGGPLHVINTCLNQTRSTRGGIYNADRKGHRLAATPLALELETGKPLTATTPEHGTLGHWVAMSGAAAAPGAGSYTSTGWSFLLFVTGVRLGYWYPRAGEATWAGTFWKRLWAWLRGSKYYRLASEALARFEGVDETAWYVSDGGHFENTGVHALLRRELDFILLADCGADPKFELSDLENLIRKARIDYDARIEFYSRDAIWRHLNLPGDNLSVLSPDDLSHNYSARGVLLARITYRRGSEDPAHWRYGTLLVVKPNLHQALDADLLGYARRNPGFPQQSTGDQFFDEAQWESYHRLGEDFGEAMTPAWMAQMPGWNSPVDPKLHHDCIIRTTSPFKPNYAESEPGWRTGAKAAAIGATLGLSALAAAALPVWQAYEQETQKQEEKAVKVSQARKEAFTNLPWALRNRLPTEQERAKVYNDGTVESVLTVYQALRQEKWSGAAERLDVRAVITIQNACGVQRQDSYVAQRCPQNSAEMGELCRAVCDRGPESRPYWISPGLSGAVAQTTQLAKVISAPRPVEKNQPDLQARSVDDLPGEGSPVPGPAEGAIPDTATTSTVESWRRPVDNLCILRDDAEKERQREVASSPNTASTIPRRVTLYVQVYDQATKQIAQALDWDEPGVTMPGIENVTAKTKASDQRPPFAWSRPTLVMHRSNLDSGCANQVGEWLRFHLPRFYGNASKLDSIDIRQLPERYKSRSPIIELWLPPATVTPAPEIQQASKEKVVAPPPATAATASKTEKK